MKSEVINGLRLKSDIELFYIFLAKFDEIVEHFNYAKHKKSFFDIIKKDSIVSKKKYEANDILVKKETIKRNEIIMIKTGNVPVSFIKHLRNSIAHGQISLDRSRYVICDKVKYGKNSKLYGYEYFTAYGIYDKTKIVSLINFLLSILVEN